MRLWYQAHVADQGWLSPVADRGVGGTTGRGRRMEAVKIWLEGAPPGMQVTYQAHVAGIGWQAPVSNGELAGTTGQARQMEALRVNLVNAPAGVRLMYQANVAGQGWLPPVTDGGVAGTTGQSRQMEALMAWLETGPTTSIPVDYNTVKRFAPKVYLHPYDLHHPTSVENYLRTVQLVDQRGNVKADPVTLDTLQQFNDPSFYLRFKNQNLPTASNDIATGDPIGAGSQTGFGRCQAPVYVHVRPGGADYVDIVYVFFYAFNGFQTFRAGLGLLDQEKRNFVWARFARHEGDMEHISVRLGREGALRGVYYGQHGDSEWVASPPLADGTHPVVYAALNSHASLPVKDARETGRIVPEKIPPVPPLRWVKTVDLTADDQVNVYTKPNPFYSVVEWTPWQDDRQLVWVDNSPDAQKWLSFPGAFGTPNLDNTHVDRPPSLPSSAQDRLFDLAKVVNFLDKLPEKLKKGDGPGSPATQGGGWWMEKEPNR